MKQKRVSECDRANEPIDDETSEEASMRACELLFNLAKWNEPN